MLTWSLANVQAERYGSLKGGDILAALGHDFPKLEIKRPTFFSSSNDVASSNVGAVQLSATGVSVSPCAIPIGPVGASISATVSAVPSSSIALHFHCALSSCSSVASWVLCGIEEHAAPALGRSAVRTSG